jgi:protein phosphatase inhibitor 2
VSTSFFSLYLHSLFFFLLANNIDNMTLHSTPDVTSGSPPKRPKGILKNRSTSNANANVNPPIPSPVATEPEPSTNPERPTANRELSEREIVLANTLHNAGPRRRSSSNPRGPPSRRQSANGSIVNGDEADENSPRLKWDEANLYLAEQSRGDHMKITEPKTPYAKQYDPAEDEDEISRLNDNELASGLNADDLLVDEVDKKHAIESGELVATPSTKRTRDEDIPGLDLGEPEVDTVMAESAPTPESEKRVMVDADGVVGDEGHHGEQELGNMSEEDREKHIRFEKMRKKHYEMKNIKGLLGHPEELDDLDDDNEQPPLPSAPN